MQQEKRNTTTPCHGKPSVGTRKCTCCDRVDREAALRREKKSHRGETLIATTPNRPSTQSPKRRAKRSKDMPDKIKGFVLVPKSARACVSS